MKPESFLRTNNRKSFPHKRELEIFLFNFQIRLTDKSNDYDHQ
jgi:hypothetical protein